MPSAERTPIEEWFLGASRGFPGHGTVDYHARYLSADNFLNTEVHPQVERGALLRGDGYLTDHGPLHIKTVMRRASSLLGNTKSKLSPYEMYLFLMAAHLHDVGNFFGRLDHAERIPAVLDKLRGQIQGDPSELRLIASIAMAHTGHRNGDKDTIGVLRETDHMLGEDVRPQLLAALLRFADELSDDSTRAARFPLQVDAVPKPSEVYHQFAFHLQSVRVYPSEKLVSLKFNLNRQQGCILFGKGGTEVYLLDEIYERTLKLHLERTYCSRYLVPVVHITALDIRIEIYPSDFHTTAEVDIGYRLGETGYPVLPEDIRKLAPGLQYSGSSLREHLERLTA